MRFVINANFFQFWFCMTSCRFLTIFSDFHWFQFLFYMPYFILLWNRWQSTDDGISYVLYFQQGHRRETLNEVYWLMSFFESASLIEGQVLSNWLIGNNVEKTISSPSTVAVYLAIIGIIYISKGWSEVPLGSVKEYKTSFHTHIFGGNNNFSIC